MGSGSSEGVNDHRAKATEGIIFLSLSEKKLLSVLNITEKTS